MKNLYVIILVISLFGCSQKNRYARLSKVYQNSFTTQGEKKTFKERGYMQDCVLKVNAAPISCSLVLETYQDFKFIKKYEIDLEQGDELRYYITPEFYYLTVHYQSREFQFNLGNSYFPAWSVNLTNHLEKVEELYQQQTGEYFIIKL